jgi:hypothetical protein
MHKFAPLLYSYMLVPTCFGSSLPSSESFWIRLSHVKIQIDMVVYHIKWLTCVATSPFYMINHHIDLYFHVTQTDPEAL